MKRLGLILLLLPIVSAADVVVPIDAVQNNVNIRQSPETGSDIVGRLPQGEWLALTERVPGWNGVELPDGSTGYISADWTRVLDNAPASSKKAEPLIGADTAEETDGAENDDSASATVQDDAVAAATEPEVADDVLPTAEDDADEATEESVASAVSPGDDDTTTVSGLADPRVEEPLGAIVETVGVSAEAPEAVADIDEPHAEPATASAPVAHDIPEPVIADADLADTESPVTPEQAEAAVLEAPVETTEPVVAEAPVAPVVSEPVTVKSAEPATPAVSAALADVEGTVDFLMKFTAPTIGGNSQIFDDGNFVGIGTTEPKQRLEVNGNIQINEQNSSVAGLMITQSGGETGYIMHNRASKLTIGAGSVDRITIDRDGNVGFGVNRPVNPIELPSGAHVTHGGVWTNSSSRARKENIEILSADEAIETLEGLEPVHFNYRNDRDESYIGFIAEDVPDLVATSDREGLSAMDIVAVLTKVVQEQQKQIEALEAKLDQR
jgi:hypothetical protein